MAGIVDIDYILPEQSVTNEQLEKIFADWTEDKIYEKTGIETRHIVQDGETAVDLAAKAVEKLFNKNAVQKRDIDFLIYVTQSPDYIMPSSACVLQDKVGLGTNVGAFDVNLGCSGYIYGLGIAKALVNSGMARKILLVTADTYSRYIHPLDRSVRTIFGDAATATIIGEDGWQIGESDFGTDGKGKDLFIIPAGGIRQPKSESTQREYEDHGNVRTDEHIFMDGPGIFDFTIREVPSSIDRVLKKEDIQKEDIDLYVLHQANKFMLDFLRKTMQIEPERFYINFSDVGNTVSSSIPIALTRAMNDDKLKRVETILLSGFGVGLSWGTTVLRRGVRV